MSSDSACLPSSITKGSATTTFTYDADHARTVQTAPGETTVYINRRQPNGLDAATTPIPAITHHGYTGHEHLDGLGLIHMNARVYDPSVGRFTSADPIGVEGGH